MKLERNFAAPDLGADELKGGALAVRSPIDGSEIAGVTIDTTAPGQDGAS